MILSDYPLRASRDFDGAIRATVADLLGLPPPAYGTSFAAALLPAAGRK